MNPFLQQNWEGLSWSDWVPLDAPTAAFRVISAKPGFYRIRVVDQSVLAYIGQTGRSLQRRLYELRWPLYASDTDMPWNDPHTAAQSLWALRIAEGMLFACSAAPAELDTPTRQIYEDMLLWRYRLEQGESTLCNHGRFHPRYSRSTNRKQGKRGGLLPTDEINAASRPSFPPLHVSLQ